MWNYTIKAEVVTGRFSRQVETFSVQANDLTDAMIQIEKNVKIGRVICSTSVKNKDNKMTKLQSRLAENMDFLDYIILGFAVAIFIGISALALIAAVTVVIS